MQVDNSEGLRAYLGYYAVRSEVGVGVSARRQAEREQFDQ